MAFRNKFIARTAVEGAAMEDFYSRVINPGAEAYFISSFTY